MLVVGGSQGSAALNRLVLDAVAGVSAGRLPYPEDLQLLWATGPAHESGIRSELEAGGVGSWVVVRGYIDDMPLALAASNLAVSRAGAMATSEFLAWHVPAVLVPLPTAAADHQARNARALAEAGAAVCLPQDELDGERLWREVSRLVSDPSTLRAMARAAADRAQPEATSRIAAALDELLPCPEQGGGSIMGGARD
jgi:UDP-N-acetylglucosamine--N-acetylmuramyl-(pentapeptide) pyrophosphoryl-undecaprenol N-acetylglucosamine transferase